MKQSFTFIAKFLLTIAVATAAVWGVSRFPRNRCDQQVAYDVKPLDSRFPANHDQAVAAAETATQLWEKAINKDLFVYKPGARFTVQFTFDQRQEQSNSLATLEKEIETQKNAIEEKKKSYESSVSDYNKKLKTYEDTVAYWNKRGGAPDDVYDQLEQQRNELDTTAASLNATSQDINTAANTLNAKIDELNNQPETTIDEGQYTKNRITVFEFKNTPELTLVLAHEFGHSLGLDHLPDPRSVMNATLKQQPLDPITLTQEDIAALTSVCTK